MRKRILRYQRVFCLDYTKRTQDTYKKGATICDACERGMEDENRRLATSRRHRPSPSSNHSVTVTVTVTTQASKQVLQRLQ